MPVLDIRARMHQQVLVVSTIIVYPLPVAWLIWKVLPDQGSIGILIALALLVLYVHFLVNAAHVLRYSVGLDGSAIRIQRAFGQRRFDMSSIHKVRFHVHPSGVDTLAVQSHANRQRLVLRLGNARKVPLPSQQLEALADLVDAGLDPDVADTESRDAARRLRQRSATRRP